MTIVLIIVAAVLILGLTAAVLLQQRRTANRPFDSTEADARALLTSAAKTGKGAANALDRRYRPAQS